MNREQKVRRVLNILVFTIYIVLLVNLIVIKGPLFYKAVSRYSMYTKEAAASSHTGYNLVPFHTIKGYLFNDYWIFVDEEFANLFGNIALFVPFGFLAPLVTKRLAKFRNLFLTTLFISLLFEAFQFFTHSGFTDVDDLILNSLGGILGFLFYIAIYR